MEWLSAICLAPGGGVFAVSLPGDVDSARKVDVRYDGSALLEPAKVGNNVTNPHLPRLNKPVGPAGITFRQVIVQSADVRNTLWTQDDCTEPLAFSASGNRLAMSRWQTRRTRGRETVTVRTTAEIWSVAEQELIVSYDISWTEPVFSMLPADSGTGLAVIEAPCHFTFDQQGQVDLRRSRRLEPQIAGGVTVLRDGQPRVRLEIVPDVASFSADGNVFVAYASDQGLAKAFDLRTGKTQDIENLHGDRLAISPDGTLLATGYETPDDNKPIRPLPGGMVQAKQDSKKQLELHSNTVVELRRVADGRVHRVLQGHKFAVRTAAFSPDGKIVATGSDDKSIRLWDVFTGQQRCELKGHNGAVLSLTFAADGSLLISGDKDGKVLVWAAIPAEEFAGPPSKVASAETPSALRIRRLGQLFEECTKLLKEQRTAETAFKELNDNLKGFRSGYQVLTNQLTAVQREIAAEMASMQGAPNAVNRRLISLQKQETAIEAQMAAAQKKTEPLLPQWNTARDRKIEVSKAVSGDLAVKRAEWLWLCDPLGKLGAGPHRDSIEMFTQQVDEDDRFVLAYLARGFDYLHTKRPTNALADFAKVAELDESLAEAAAAARGWAYTRMGENSLANQEFRKTQKPKSDSPLVELLYGGIYAEQQKDTIAENHFRAAVDGRGEDLPQTHEALASFLAAHFPGDARCAKLAIREATKACEMTDWSQWMYLDTLAKAHAAAGDFQLAIGWTEKAIQRAPQDDHAELQKQIALYKSKIPDSSQ